MDIQAILDASDSSSSGDEDRTASFLNANSPTSLDRPADIESPNSRRHNTSTTRDYGTASTPPLASEANDAYAQSYANAMAMNATGTAAAAEAYGMSGMVMGVDLEQILREHDDDDDDYDDYDQEGARSNSNSNSNGLDVSFLSTDPNDLDDDPRSNWSSSSSHHSHIPPHVSSSASSSNYGPVTSATGEDWDVLQAILGDEDDDDDDDEADILLMPGVRGNNSSSFMPGATSIASSSHRYDYNQSAIPAATSTFNELGDDWNSLSHPARSQVDAILQQSDDENGDNDVEDIMTDKLGVSSTSFWANSVSSVLHAPSPGDVGPTPTDSFVTAAQSDLSNSDGISKVPSSDTPTITAAPSSDWDLEKASEKSMAYARAYQRKLLKSGHRDIVSPLMVKRRLKPKIELNTKQQQLRRLKDEQAAALDKEKGRSKSNKAKAPPSVVSNMQNTPVKFGFSGVIDNKHMPRVSSILLKNAPDLPTALCINSRFIAVGTQKGLILVFDLFESLRQKLTNGGDTPFNIRTAGSVTTIDLSLVHGEVLAAGYTSGYIVLWDTIKGVALRTVIENHNPSPITNVRFLSKLNLVTVDAGGLVHKLNFSKNILWSSYNVESECLLDGTAGQILAMNVLDPYSAVHQQLPFATPAMKKIVLIALSSGRSSFAVAVEPTVHVLHRWAKPTEEQMQPPPSYKPSADEQVYLPCLSWGWALLSGGGHARTPILARAWGCSIQLLRASFQEDEEETSIPQEVFPWPAFGVHDEFQSSAPIVAMEWLNDRSLVYLTVTNEFTVVDTVMMTLLERLDFSELRLVYAEFSLSRKVTEKKSEEDAGSMAAASTEVPSNFCTTFQNSIRSRDNRLLLLCQEELKTITILGAKQRVSALEEDGEWLEALALALDHYENTIASQQDRRRDQSGRKDLSQHPEYYSQGNFNKSDDEEWIAKLLIRYMTIAVENAPEMTEDLPPELLQSQLELAQSHFQMLAGVCVEFCVVTKRLDLLFGSIFRRFHAAGFLTVFLDVLEPYILNDKLDYVAPEAMAHFVEHCRTTNGIATVERCLLHMDVTIMDFDSILGLLRANEMYSALFYVFNQGLSDYTSPMEILCEKIFDAADTVNLPDFSPLARKRKDGAPKNALERYGYKAILYLQSCFQGLTFPKEIPMEDSNRVAGVRSQLLSFLLQERFAPNSVRRPAEVIGQRCLRYPYTHLLLMVDPKAMLETFSMAMNATDASMHSSDSADGEWENGEPSTTHAKSPDRQEIISVLLSIIMPNEQDELGRQQSSIYQSQPAVNAFLDFMAEYLMKGVVQANKVVTYMILRRMSTRFETATVPEDRLQSQRQILQLLTALPRTSYDTNEVLTLVQKSGVHRAALLLHQEGATSWGQSESQEDIEARASHFKAAIDCYLEDDEFDFRKEVFAYVKKECSGGSQHDMDVESSESPQPNALRDALGPKLVDLVKLDSLLAAELVAELFVDDLDTVIENLRDENAQYLFFKAIVSGDLDRQDQVSGAVLNANLTTDHHHQYMALMAKLHPDDVYDYLQSHDNYRPEVCLPICQKYEIADASCYLLERMGNVSSALQLILQTLEGRMMGLKRTIRGVGTEFYSKYTSPRNSSAIPFRRKDHSNKPFDITEREIEGVKRILVVALDLCQRNSGTFSTRTEHGSQLWFNVLDRLINAKGFLRLSKEQPAHAKVMAGVLSELLRLTMQRMVSSVPLPDLVRKVTSDHSGSRLGELREMVESLLSTYGFELNVFSGAINVFHHDSKTMQREHKGLRMQGSHVRTVLNVPLDENMNGLDLKSKFDSLPDGSVLEVGEGGNMSISDSGSSEKGLSSRAGGQGLGNALNRLRSRRRAGGGGSVAPKAPTVKQELRSTGLNFMTCNEQSYSRGILSPDVTYFEDRIGGMLGDAEHRGRLMSFMY